MLRNNTSVVASNRPCFVQLRTRRKQQAVVPSAVFMRWRDGLPARDLLVEGQYFARRDDLEKLIRCNEVEPDVGATLGRLLGSKLPRAKDARMVKCPACELLAPHQQFHEGVCRRCSKETW